jgi:hypothetical protein
VTSRFELEDHELTLLRQAAVVADSCEALRAVVAVEGRLIVWSSGEQRVHPALVELRQQQILLARLVTALRVPLAEDSQARPQRRGVRGVYALPGGSS